MRIHKEGIGSLVIIGIVLLVINAIIIMLMPFILVSLLGAISVIFFLFIINFFRNPKVITSAEDHEVVAPANGKVVVIEHTHEDEYLKKECKQVSIFMSPMDVHVNRIPIGGEIKYYKYHAGKYLVAWHPKSSTENERTTIALDHRGTSIVFRQIAGALARRIKCYLSENQLVSQGQEFGFIKFGSRVDLFLPLSADIIVKIGDRTKAGRTVIARLK